MFDIKQKDSLILSMLILIEQEGQDSFHLEDIALKNKENFPTFFTWSKYKENIDLRQVMRSLDQLKRDGLLVGSNTKSWTLTQSGMIFAKKLKNISQNNEQSSKKFRKGIDFYRREKERILISDAFIKFSSNEIEKISERDLKYLYRIDGYNSSLESINRNKERLYKACLGDNELNKFLDKTLELLNKYKIFGGLND